MNNEQMRDVQDELTKIQDHFLQMFGDSATPEEVSRGLRWANTIGTVRILLDVFRDEWIKYMIGGEPRVETPQVTSGTCNDFDGLDDHKGPTDRR